MENYTYIIIQIKKQIDSVLNKFNFYRVFEQESISSLFYQYKKIDFLNETNFYLKIQFVYLLRDQVFSFIIYSVKGEDVYKEKTFWRIFMEMDPSVKYVDIQPVGRDYLPALQRNSELLERFLDLVFKQGKTELIQELFE